jgi:hypothetical protein
LWGGGGGAGGSLVSTTGGGGRLVGGLGNGQQSLCHGGLPIV